MKIQIKNRYTDAVIYEGEAPSLKAAVEKCVSELRLYLGGANLGGAYLDGADLRGADLRGAYLRGANLRGAYLDGADLDGADLRGADLRGAYLDGADLRGADLRGADLRGAYLRGAYLRGADLRGATGLNKYLTTPLYLLRDQPGPIRAYKLVNAAGVGPFTGGITYAVGGAYEVADANTDESEQCAAGINLATLDWCLKEWREGYRILVAEFAPDDIAAIPLASDGKFRVRRCRIVAEKTLADIGLMTPTETAAAETE